MTTAATATARLTTVRLRHPVRNEAAHIVDLDAWADAAHLVAQHGRRVDVVHVVAATVATTADDIAAHVNRVASGFRGEARRAHGAAWRRVGIGIAAFLGIAWFDAVSSILSGIIVFGGPAAPLIVAAIPAIAAFGTAFGHARRARRFGQIGETLASARVRRATLIESGGDAVNAFVAECLPALTEFADVIARLPDAPLDACARASVLAIGISRAAARHGLASVATAYQSAHVVLAAAEARASRAEQAGGMFADSRVRSALRRAHAGVDAALAPFRVVGGVRSSYFAPLTGLISGAAIVSLTMAIAGTYIVPPDAAVIIDPPVARAARLADAVGLDLAPFGLDGGMRDVVRTPGAQWSWPPPFSDRRVVVLGDQYATVRAVVLQTGPDTFTVLQVRIRFRIVDLARWARYDAAANGATRLGRGLSSELQGRLETVARELVQRASRDPALAQNPRVMARQVEQVMVMQLPAMLGQFAGIVNGFDVVAEAGVRIDTQIRQTDVGLDRTATAATAGLGTGP